MFKGNFSVGIDCAEVSRWRRMLPDLRDGPSRRLFSRREHRYCRSSPDAAARYAQLWCAKEAVFKALSPGISADLRRIEILVDKSGRVMARPPFAGPYRKPALTVSLSLGAEVAAAVAVACF